MVEHIQSQSIIIIIPLSTIIVIITPSTPSLEHHSFIHVTTQRNSSNKTNTTNDKQTAHTSPPICMRHTLGSCSYLPLHTLPPRSPATAHL